MIEATCTQAPHRAPSQPSRGVQSPPPTLDKQPLTRTQVETYITGKPIGSSGCKGVLLFLTDVFGHRFINAQLLADEFAAHGGFHVLMPDLFAGDSRPPRPLGSDPPPSAESINEWLQRHTHAQTRPIVDAVLAQLRAAPQPLKLVAVGYCFGAKYVTQLLGEGVLHAGFTAHPSFVLPEELAAVRAPLSIAAAGLFPPPLSRAGHPLPQPIGLPG